MLLYRPQLDIVPEGLYIEVGPNGEELEEIIIVYVGLTRRLPLTEKSDHLWKKV